MKGTGASMTSRALLGRMGTNIPAHSKGARSSLKAVVMAVTSPAAAQYVIMTSVTMKWYGCVQHVRVLT